MFYRLITQRIGISGVQELATASILPGSRKWNDGS